MEDQPRRDAGTVPLPTERLAGLASAEALRLIGRLMYLDATAGYAAYLAVEERGIPAGRREALAG